MECINLRSRFGREYRIRHDESYAAERPEFRAAEELWLQIIPCRHGHIYPAGGNRLAVSTNQRGPVANRIRRLPFVEVLQDGSDGINATFPVERFEDVAAIVRPKRRRVVSEQERLRLAELSRRHGFKPKHISQDAPSGPERAQTPPGVSGDVQEPAA